MSGSGELSDSWPGLEEGWATGRESNPGEGPEAGGAEPVPVQGAGDPGEFRPRGAEI